MMRKMAVVVERHQHGGKCNMCKEDIYSFQLCYYHCKWCDDYSLHKFCAELPLTLKNHHLHPAHNLTFVRDYRNWCGVCKDDRTNDGTFIGYHCSICLFRVDIICATLSQQKMVHPSHPGHQLERMIGTMISKCHACGNEHKGTFYHCAATDCVWFRIHLDCALLPAKLLIQQATDESFTHSHPLTLAYSYVINNETKYIHMCRVCNSGFKYSLWLYKCHKCRYYAHVDCATSKKEPFMSIFLKQGNIFKNFQDDDHPNLLKCPFPDESHNLLTHTFSNRSSSRDFLLANKSYFGHQHPLVLFNSSSKSVISLLLHNPMKRIQLLCDGCVKPITMVPFYKCENNYCSFVLHTWCATMLPSEIRDHPGHHSVLALDRNAAADIFMCGICELPSNGFAYACTKSGHRVDINCAFLPKEITHEAHPNHLLSLVTFSFRYGDRYYCIGCDYYVKKDQLVYHCPSCNIYLHTRCALFLPKIVRHKYADKHHPLSLRYEPVENHPSEYFCDICEQEFDPREWFYHCTTCDASMHSACAPVILQCEKAVRYSQSKLVFKFLNVKFGGSFKMGNHPHRLIFDQGIKGDGHCPVCYEPLKYEMIVKCYECNFAFHYSCVSRYASFRRAR